MIPSTQDRIDVHKADVEENIPSYLWWILALAGMYLAFALGLTLSSPCKVTARQLIAEQSAHSKVESPIDMSTPGQILAALEAGPGQRVYGGLHAYQKIVGASE